METKSIANPSNKPVKVESKPAEAEHVVAPPLPAASHPADSKTTTVSTASLFVGPLPPPDMLAAYEQAVPGLGKQLVTLLHTQARHRMDLEAQRQKATIELEKSSPNYAIAVAAMSVLSVTLLGLYGNPWAASIVGGLEVVSLVSLFVYGKHNQGKGS
jgi:uncharacterized membrane protein